MATSINQDLGAIFNHYSDVIEGGNTYASGTTYKGIPGLYSHDENAGVSLTANDASSSSVPVADVSVLDNAKIVDTSVPPIFIECLTATNSDNVGTARKITGVDTSDVEFDVGSNWPAATTSGDTFITREGFKRLPDNLDILTSPETDNAYDRFFQFEAMAGSRLPWYGNNCEQYETTLTLRICFLKRARARNWRQSAIDNIGRMRIILTKPSLRDSTYVQLLTSEGTAPSIEDETENRIIVADEYRLVYRVSATYS